MKKILNIFHHRVLTNYSSTFFGDFTEDYHWKLNELAQIFKFHLIHVESLLSLATEVSKVSKAKAKPSFFFSVNLATPKGFTCMSCYKSVLTLFLINWIPKIMVQYTTPFSNVVWHCTNKSCNLSSRFFHWDWEKIHCEVIIQVKHNLDPWFPSEE